MVKFITLNSGLIVRQAFLHIMACNSQNNLFLKMSLIEIREMS